MASLLISTLALFPSAFSPSLANASGPSSNRLLNYQLRLTDPSGIPVADGTKNVKISFYAASTGGTPVATDCGTTGTPVGRKIVFTNGVGSVLIGETTADASHNCTDGSAPNAISATLFDNTSLFIGIAVESDAEMTPRKRIVATGYSLNADKLDDMETSKDGGVTEGLSAASYVPVTDTSGNFTLTRNVTVDTNTFFVDATNNRVGVGTVTPAEELEARTNQNSSTYIQATNTTTGGAASAGFGAVADNANAGLYFRAFSTGFTTAGLDIANYGQIQTDVALAGLIVKTNGVGDPIIFGTGDVERARIDGSGHFLPGADDTYDLGSNAFRWRDLFLGPATLHIGTTTGDEGILTYNTTTNLLSIDSTGAVDINGGSTSSGCSVDVSGNLTCTGTVAGTGGGFWTLDGTSQTVTADKDMTLSGGVNGLSFDGTTFSVDAANNRIGIGTAAPASPLHVYGDVNANVGLRFENPNAGASASTYFHSTDGTRNSLFGMDGNGTSTNRTNRAYIYNDAAGVGLYAVNASGIIEMRLGASEVRRFSISAAGTTLIEGPSGGTAFTSTDNVNSTLSVSHTSAVLANEVWLRGTSGSNLTLGANEARALTINTAGNVGIGTTGPVAMLNVYEPDESATQTNLTQAVTDAGLLVSYDLTNAAYTGGLFWNTPGNNPTKPKAGIYLFNDNSNGTTMLFGTSNSFATGITNTALAINHAGSVGIGDTSPAALLTVGNGDVFQLTGAGLISVAPTSTGTLMDYALETEWTAGTILNADYASATTQTGDVVGANLNFTTNFTGAADQDFTGFRVDGPTLNQTTAVTTNYAMFKTLNTGLSQVTVNNAGGTVNWTGADIDLPHINQTAGTVTSSGVMVTPGGVSTGGTQKLFAMASGTNAPGGTLIGMDLTLGNGSGGVETGIQIGGNWDNAMRFTGATYPGSQSAITMTAYNYQLTDASAPTSKLIDVSLSNISEHTSGSKTVTGFGLTPTINTAANAATFVTNGFEVTPVMTACGTTGGTCALSDYLATTPALTQSTTNAFTMTGFNLSSAGTITQNTAAGTIDWRGVNIVMPILTQTTGSITGRGVYITGGASSSSGTKRGLEIEFSAQQTGGTLHGIKIGSISGAGGSETGLEIGSGWDQNLVIDGTTISNGKALQITVDHSLTTGGLAQLIDYETGSGNQQLEPLFAIESDCVGDATCSGFSNDNRVFRIDSSGEAFSDVGFTAGGASTKLRDGSLTKDDGAFAIDSSGALSINTTNNQAVNFGTGTVTAGGGLTVNGTLTTAAGQNANFDAGTLFVDAANNRVGIGTTSTFHPLDIIVPATNDAGVYMAADELTTGWGMYVDSTSDVLTSGTVLYATHDGSYTATTTVSGNVFGANRIVNVNDAGATLTLSGAVASFTDNPSVSAGTLTHTADVVQITQARSTNTGAALNVTSAGAGLSLRVNDDGTLSDSTPFAIDTSGNVGIGTAAPTNALTINTSLANSASDIASFNVNGAYMVIGDRFSPLTFTDAVGIKFYDSGNQHASLRFVPASARIDFCQSSNNDVLTCGPALATISMALSTQRVGIRDIDPDAALDVEASSETVAIFNRLATDGTIISLQQDHTEEGTISVSGNTVSYNAFTGSHYAWTDEVMERGALVTLSGTNKRLHDVGTSEILYGIVKSSRENDPRVLGSYLALQEPSKPADKDNPHLVMAAGNGDLWVAENSSNIEAGDYLIASAISGHAMKDPATHDTSNIVARALENVDWSKVAETIDGVKHALVSVEFVHFTRSNVEPGVFGADRSILTVTEDLDFRGNGLRSVGFIAGMNDTWSIDTEGNLATKGVISTDIVTDNGPIRTYAATSEQPEIVISGIGQLSGGAATITFDFDTAHIITGDTPLKVNVTLTSPEAAGIYVTDKSVQGFTVRELNGGTSNATFDWMVIARRKGFGDTIVSEPPAEEIVSAPTDTDESADSADTSAAVDDTTETPAPEPEPQPETTQDQPEPVVSDAPIE